MGFKRVWDSTCPRVWDSWESNGVKWTIQDLPPEDDEKANEIMAKHFCTDELFCAAVDFVNDPVSVRGTMDLWRKFLEKRMTLACYGEVNGVRELAALNICQVKCLGDEELDVEKEEGEPWKHVLRSLAYGDSKIDIFKHTGLDKVLSGSGLCVVKKYRGSKLGVRLLAAREPLCKSQGLKATVTLFTGIASQKCAEKAGFTTIAEIPLKEMAEAGFQYPKDDERILKLMIKKYD